MAAAILRPIAIAALLAWAAPLCAEEAPWRPVTAETGEVRDVAGLEQLAQDFPDSGTVRLRMLQPYLEAHEPEKLLDTLRWLNQHGYVFGEVPQQQIPKLIGEEHADQARALLIPKAEVIATSELIETTPAEAGLTESVLRDPIDNRLIITSVSHRGVLGKKPYAGWDGFAIDGVANISGIALGQDNQIVWLGAGHIDGSDPDGTFTGLVGLTRVGRELIKIAAPEGVSISDITVAADGTIYGSDPVGGGVYRAAPDDEAARELVPPGTFRSPQGLATSEDNTKLYVSDYRYGIAIIDLETRAVSRLVSDIPVILDGVDGLWRYGNALIAVQNGTSPMRIAAFELSEDGMRVIRQRILEQANPEWTEPLSGSIDGDRLLYIGNGQWDRFVQGEQVPGKPFQPTQIRSLSLSHGGR